PSTVSSKNSESTLRFEEAASLTTSLQRRPVVPTMSLSGRRALVTGGSSGIGEGVCRALAEEGAQVIVASTGLERATKVAQSLPGSQGHQAFCVDVANADSVAALFENIRKSSSTPLSIVVNSAGILKKGDLVDFKPEEFDDLINVNVRGTFLVNQAAARDMVASGVKDAVIVNVSSILGKGPYPGFSAYSASKFAVVGLTKTVAQELAPKGIRCNCVLPGLTDTPLTGPLAGQCKTDILSLTALKRTARVPEVASVIKFLCSPENS
ncbi:short-chain alcohol dehydrogenase, putative, partial [Ixodes scapularis]